MPLVYTNLEDKESIVVEIDATGSQQCGHFLVCGALAVDAVVRGVVLERCTGHIEPSVWHNGEIILPYLEQQAFNNVSSNTEVPYWYKPELL